MNEEVKLLRYAARKSREDALASIQEAKQAAKPHKARLISHAAQKLRDADLFAGKANVIEIFEGDAE